MPSATSISRILTSWPWGRLPRRVCRFDEYWNHELAIPIRAFVSDEPARKDLEEARRNLEKKVEALKVTEYARRLRESDPLKRLEAGRLPMVWAKGEVLYDRPGRVNSPDVLHASNSMSPRLREIIQEAQAKRS